MMCPADDGPDRAGVGNVGKRLARRITKISRRRKSIDLMLATNSPPFSRKGWIFELKMDGYRILANKAQLMTRNQKDATKWYPKVLAALHKLPGDFVIDGEACLLDEKGIPLFEGMRGRPDKHPEPITYFAFDLLFLNGEDVRPLPLLERKTMLKQLIGKDTPQLRYVSYLETEGEMMFKHASAIGIEGIVGKRADSLYKAGRSRDWRKFKQAGWHDGWERPRQKTA